MKIYFLFFGVARDLTAIRELPMELPDGLTVGEVRKVLSERYKGMDASLGYAVAVNEQLVSDPEFLHDGDVVAILPPVSGG